MRRRAGCHLISTESLRDVCSGGLRWSWAPRLLFVWALHIIKSALSEKKNPVWNIGRTYTRAHTLTQPPGRERRVTAASRSPLLIAATLVNESISTRPPQNVSAASQERRAAAAALSLRSVLFLTRAAAEPRQFTQQADWAGGEIVKAIEHPVNFQNKNTLPIEHGHKSLSFITDFVYRLQHNTLGHNNNKQHSTQLNQTKKANQLLTDKATASQLRKCLM